MIGSLCLKLCKIVREVPNCVKKCKKMKKILVIRLCGRKRLKVQKCSETAISAILYLPAAFKCHASVKTRICIMFQFSHAHIFSMFVPIIPNLLKIREMMGALLVASGLKNS